MDNEDDDVSDRDLFRQSVGEVRRVRHDKAQPWREKPAPRPRQSEKDDQQVLEDMLSDHYYSAELQPGDVLTYMRSGVKRTTFRRLRSGRYRIDAECDLHGMRIEQARSSVAEFLAASINKGWRCVRIIHGKGLRSSNRGPVLKGLVNQWLQQRDEVLAFHSARPEDGGTGAVYVLLRKPKT